MYRSKPFRDLCENAACIACGIVSRTVIPAHRNEGKGMGLKASDAYTIPLCHSCHHEYDNELPRDQARPWFDRLHSRWLALLVEQGKLGICAIDFVAPLPKLVPRRH